MSDLLLAPRPSRSLSPSPRGLSPASLVRCASDRDPQKEQQRGGSLTIGKTNQIPLCPQLSPSQVYIVRKAWKHINTKGLVGVFRRCFQRAESCCTIIAQTFTLCGSASGSGSQIYTGSPHHSTSPISPNSRNENSIVQEISPNRRTSDAGTASIVCVRTLSEHSIFMVHLFQRVLSGDQTIVEYLRRIGARHVALQSETAFGSRQLEKFGEILVDVFLKLDGIRESKECSRAWRQLISSFVDCLRDGFEEEARQNRRKNSFNAHSRYFDDIERRHSTPARRGSLRIDVQAATRKVSNYI
ncbi:unnamed protein product, partial [Mesorhabditis belari]|uniref:Globin family profile domain-containing protein n=1 Tax=Mesorhabditis belari TaxID=2138241 RepID=A0AAF3EU58_9BILA